MKFNFKNLISALLVFFSLSSIFVGSYFSDDAKQERIADYASQVAKNQSDGDIFALTVENTKQPQGLLPVDHELYSLYGIFKQEKITFASTINSSKEHTIYLEDNFDTNLSILYVGPVGSNAYHNHFKHYVFPVELMFEDVPSKAYKTSNYISYISKTQATQILNKRNGIVDSDHEYSDEEYRSLLYQPVSFTIDGQESEKFSVINIYLEENYYCKGLNSVMGDFIISSYYLPFGLRNDQKSLYFMSKYSYQNRYFMNYINQVYSGDEYKVSINYYNIIGNIDADLITSFHNREKSDYTASLILLSISATLFLSLIIFFLIIKGSTNLGILSFTYFGTYLIFLFMYLISKNVCWFSFLGCKLFVLFGVLSAVFVFIFRAILFYRREKKKYEISI